VSISLDVGLDWGGTWFVLVYSVTLRTAFELLWTMGMVLNIITEELPVCLDNREVVLFIKDDSWLDIGTRVSGDVWILLDIVEFFGIAVVELVPEKVLVIWVVEFADIVPEVEIANDVLLVNTGDNVVETVLLKLTLRWKVAGSNEVFVICETLVRVTMFVSSVVLLMEAILDDWTTETELDGVLFAGDAAPEVENIEAPSMLLETE
jgi:hypothetical protein